jgi:hypothetical protein
MDMGFLQTTILPRWASGATFAGEEVGKPARPGPLPG